MIPYNTGRPSKIGNHSLDPFGSFPFVCNCRGQKNCGICRKRTSNSIIAKSLLHKMIFHVQVLASPLPLLTGLFNEHLITSKNPLICEVRWGIRTAMDFSWCISLCAEWEAEKGGRMGCLMKEKIQGMAERKAFILLFLIVWALEFLSHQIIKFMKSYLFPPNGWRSAPAGCGSEYSWEVGEKGGGKHAGWRERRAWQ